MSFWVRLWSYAIIHYNFIYTQTPSLSFVIPFIFLSLRFFSFSNSSTHCSNFQIGIESGSELVLNSIIRVNIDVYWWFTKTTNRLSINSRLRVFSDEIPSVSKYLQHRLNPSLHRWMIKSWFVLRNALQKI